MLVRMTSCPHCGSGINTPCYAEFTDGYKCFTCGIAKSYNKERRAFMKTPITKAAKDVPLPQYTSNPREFSLETLSWLYKYYIRDSEIRNAPIWYQDNSLIFPVIQDNEVVFYVQRFFPDKRIKNVGYKHVDKFENGNKTVVLVEDYISGVRVSEFADVWVLFGTSINSGDVSTLLDKYNYIKIWLDGDKPGMTGAYKMEDQLVRKMIYLKKKFPYKYDVSWHVKLIITEKDPKEYSPTEIERILYENN